MKSPNKCLYHVLNRLARIYTRWGKNHHFHNPDKIRISSPSIVISNHTSFFDFLYVMWACKHTPIHFVVARKYVETKPLSTILRWGHVIPKSLFQVDPMAMKQMIEVIKEGGVLGLFPEGQISITGVTLPFPQGIGKLIKKVKVPVYAVQTKGAYLKDPSWTNVKRKGRIDSELRQVLTPEAIDSLTPEEIEEQLYQSLPTNPFYETNREEFHGKNLAKGLEHILCVCPNCHHEGTMESQKNQLICQECHFTYEVQADGWLLHDNLTTNIHEAYLQQRAYERKQILSIKDYEYTLPVQVETIVDHHYQIASQGILHLRNDQIIYQSDDHFSFTIPTASVRYVPFDAERTSKYTSTIDSISFFPLILTYQRKQRFLSRKCIRSIKSQGHLVPYKYSSILLPSFLDKRE